MRLVAPLGWHVTTRYLRLLLELLLDAAGKAIFDLTLYMMARATLLLIASPPVQMGSSICAVRNKCGPD
jgi:hypothetical protein